MMDSTGPENRTRAQWSSARRKYRYATYFPTCSTVLWGIPEYNDYDHHDNDNLNTKNQFPRILSRLFGSTLIFLPPEK